MSKSLLSKANILLIDSELTPYLDDVQYENAFVKEISSITYKRGMQEINSNDLQDADVVIVYFGNSLERKHIEQLKKCKGIVAATTGYNNIDIYAANDYGIPVCNIPNYGPEDVADHTLLLLLSCARRFSSVLRSVNATEWNWHSAIGAQRLSCKKIGIIGLGSIGYAVAKRSLAFGMNVYYYDPYRQQIDDENIIKVDYLADLLGNVDILSIHCPLNHETHHLLTYNEFALMRQNTILINTARGDIIDQDALIDALNQNKFFALGLDVLSNEPSIPIALHNNTHVILTPHVAFYSRESLNNIRNIAISSAVNYLKYCNHLNSIIKIPEEINNAC